MAWVNTLFCLAEGCSLIFNSGTPPRKHSYNHWWKFYLPACKNMSVKLDLKTSALKSGRFFVVFSVWQSQQWHRCDNNVQSQRGCFSFLCLKPPTSSPPSLRFSSLPCMFKPKNSPSAPPRRLNTPICIWKRADWTLQKEQASKQDGYQTNQAANICWQLLGNISPPLFEGKILLFMLMKQKGLSGLERSENCYALLKRHMQCVYLEVITN